MARTGNADLDLRLNFGFFRLIIQRIGIGDDLDALKVERDENDQRKEPTTSEKVALAEAIAERLQGRVGRPGNGGNISTFSDDAGKTRDIAAAKAGLGSAKRATTPAAHVRATGR